MKSKEKKKQQLEKKKISIEKAKTGEIKKKTNNFSNLKKEKQKVKSLLWRAAGLLFGRMRIWFPSMYFFSSGQFVWSWASCSLDCVGGVGVGGEGLFRSSKSLTTMYVDSVLFRFIIFPAYWIDCVDLIHVHEEEYQGKVSSTSVTLCLILYRYRGHVLMKRVAYVQSRPVDRQTNW